MMVRSVVKAPAISSLGEPAIRRWASELANMKHATMMSSVWKPRMLTLSVGSALRYRPAG
jgi:hypothetical protein